MQATHLIIAKPKNSRKRFSICRIIKLGYGCAAADDAASK
jgi:hypothetical protein